MPSTPSPDKAENRSFDIESNGGKDAAKEKDKEVVLKGHKKAKPAKAEVDMNPMELAMNLEALLPRRPKPKAAGRGHDTKEADSDGDKHKGRKDNRGKAQTKYNGKGKQRIKDVDGEEDEEAKRHRQARIDYFNKLDGYEVQKEDVYIV